MVRGPALLAVMLTMALAAMPGRATGIADDVTVTSITPAAGPAAGGDGIVIVGNGFAEDSGVFLGGTRATDVIIVDSSMIVAKTPTAAAPRTATVSVMVVNGNGSGILPDGYKFVSPLFFGDDPLNPGITVKAQHVLELRDAIDLTRFAANQSAATWTGTLTPGATPISAVHMLELRSNLEQALGFMHFPSTTYTDPSIPPAAVTVKAVHVQEVRTRLRRTGPFCGYALSAQYYGFEASGGSINVSVTTGASCDWAVAPDDSWTSITSGGPHTGSGSFEVNVPDNSMGSPRQTMIWVGDQRFVVSQGT
jgi:IPT/TIG domain-containing protein